MGLLNLSIFILAVFIRNYYSRQKITYAKIKAEPNLLLCHKLTIKLILF